MSLKGRNNDTPPLMTLKELFVWKGDTYTQVEETRGGFCYQVNGSNNFEVFERIIEPYKVFENGAWRDTGYKAITYPRESQWGTRAWTFISIEKALQKLKEITEDYERRCNEEKMGRSAGEQRSEASRT
jgi:hypothetical protein